MVLEVQGHTPRGVCGLKLVGNCECGFGISHTPRGVCGLKPQTCFVVMHWCSHTPRGVCGLKQDRSKARGKRSKSHSTRSVWIETSMRCWPTYHILVTLHEECVDWNPQTNQRTDMQLGHTPRGVCGLKHTRTVGKVRNSESHSTRSVWIETLSISIIHSWLQVTLHEECVDWNHDLGIQYKQSESHSTRSVWIETRQLHNRSRNRMSHSTRSVWIETSKIYVIPG